MKALRIIRNLLLALVVLVLLLLVAFQVILRPRVLTRIVNRIAAEYVDGDLVFSQVKASVVKDFPFLNVTLDDAALTYPHDRYARYDSTFVEKGRFPLLQAGRAPEKDTLASFRRLSASVNYVNLIKGTGYDVRRVELDHPRIFAHYYDSTAANWDILPLGGSSDTTSKELPPIRLHKVHLTGRPYIVYTDQQDTLFGLATMKHLLADGRFDSRSPSDSKVKILTDSLFLNGRLPADTVAIALQHLEAEGKDRRVQLSADARAFLSTRLTGRLRVPIHIETDTAFPERADGCLEALVHSLALGIATIDLKGNGDIVLRKDGTEIRADASIERCPLGELLETYQENFPVLKKVRTDAVLDLEAHCDGLFSRESLPRIQAHLQVPDAFIDYEGLGRRGQVSLDVDAATDVDRKLDLDLNRVLLDIVGAHLDLKGTAADVAGEDPFFAVSGQVRARVDSLTRAFTKEYGITGTGSLSGSIDAQARLSQLTASKIGHADIKGDLVARNLSLDDTKDQVKAFVERADITLETKGNRLDDNLRRGARVLALDATLDTLDATYKGSTYLRGSGIRLQAQNSAAILQGGKELTPLMGVLQAVRLHFRDEDGMAVSLRDNTENFRITPSTKDFHTPKLSLASQSTGVRFRSGANGALLRNLKFDVTANRHQSAARRSSARMEHLLDSLQRVWPGVSRDSLLLKFRRNRPRRALPVWLQESDFRKKDIRISLSDAVRQYYRDWDFSGSVSLERGNVLYPSFPLRTQVNNLKSAVSNDRIDLKNVTVTAGGSDVTAKGSLGNLRRSILGPGTLELDALVTSDFLDINELLRAYAYHKAYKPARSMERASDEALEKAIAQAELPDSTGSKLLVIPANLNAKVSLEASGVRYDSLDVSWLAADLAMKQRTLQITNALAATNMGDIFLEGFYATRSKKDIKTGFDLRFEDVTAEKVITLFPAVDTLMPMLKSFAGDLNCELAATADMDTSMRLILPSIDGILKISGKDLSIASTSQEFQKIARYLLFKNKKGAYVEGMTVTGMVRDDVLEVFPFVMDLDRYTLAASGLQHLDEAFTYHLSSIKSPLLVKFGVNVWGEDFNHVKYGLARAKYRSVNVPDFSKQLDTVQYSLLASIHNIFELGVEKAIEENNSQRYIQARMDASGYSGADTLAAPKSVTDSLTLMSQRFEAAGAQPDREALKEEVLDLAEKSAAKKEEENEQL
ncbi:MAG: hypothetical protein II874_00330 [Bacteroidales bacterium]|nr:hypothetical protein [Bacteroidales bacterium]